MFVLATASNARTRTPCRTNAPSISYYAFDLKDNSALDVQAVGKGGRISVPRPPGDNKRVVSLVQNIYDYDTGLKAYIVSATTAADHEGDVLLSFQPWSLVNRQLYLMQGLRETKAFGEPTLTVHHVKYPNRYVVVAFFFLMDDYHSCFLCIISILFLVVFVCVYVCVCERDC